MWSGVRQICNGISKTAFFDLTLPSPKERDIGVFEIPLPLYKTVVPIWFTFFIISRFT